MLSPVDDHLIILEPTVKIWEQDLESRKNLVLNHVAIDGVVGVVCLTQSAKV